MLSGGHQSEESQPVALAITLCDPAPVVVSLYDYIGITQILTKSYLRHVVTRSTSYAYVKHFVAQGRFAKKISYYPIICLYDASINCEQYTQKTIKELKQK